MGELREHRNMRKAKRLMWLCIVPAVMALVPLVCASVLAVHLKTITSTESLMFFSYILSILFSTIFFCLYQRGFRTKQLSLLLPVCAINLYQLYISCLSNSFSSSLSISDAVFISNVLIWLSKVMYLLVLMVGLKKNDRRILRCAKNLMIATVIIRTINIVVFFGYYIVSVGLNWSVLLTIGTLIDIYACEMIIYALIAYRGVATDDITLLGYPVREAKAALVESATNISTTQGGQVMMGTKSKVVAALLAFFLGGIGAHRYYLGYDLKGAFQSCGFISLVAGWMMYAPSIVNQNSGEMILSGLLLFYGGVVGIWAFIDFIRILTGGLAPADGLGYAVQQVQVVQTAPAPASGADELEKLAKLRDAGILTEEEFQTKKAEILARL